MWLDTAKEYRKLYPPEKYELVLIGNSLWYSLAKELPYWDKVIPELKGLDQEGKHALQKAAKEKFDLKNDNIEFIIEEAISVLLSAGYLVKRCVDLRKKVSEG